MKMKASVGTFRSNLLIQCKKLLRVFRFKRKIPVFIKSLRHGNRQGKLTKKLLPPSRVAAKSRKEMDRVAELRSVSDKVQHYQLPLTPDYVRASRAGKMKSSSGNNEVEIACESFESYLVNMIVDERKLKDLMDVEELLYCWTNLKCPVFKALVCRFYGELCKDLFSPAHNT